MIKMNALVTLKIEFLLWIATHGCFSLNITIGILTPSFASEDLSGYLVSYDNSSSGCVSARGAGECLHVAYEPISLDSSTASNSFRLFQQVTDISQMPVTAIASLACPASIEEMRHLLSAKRIPVIQLPCLNAPVNSTTCHHNHITHASLMAAALQIVTSLGWDELVLFYDESTGYAATDLMVTLNRRGISVVLADTNTLRSPNHSNYVTTYNNFLIFANQQSTNMTQLLSLNGPLKHWLIVDDCSLNVTSLIDSIAEGDNVAVLTPDDSDLSTSDIMMLLEAAIVNAWSSCHSNSSHGDAHAYDCFLALLPQEVAARSSSVRVLTSAVSAVGTLEFQGVGRFLPASQQLSFRLPALYPQLLEGYNNRLFRIGSIHFPPFCIQFPNGTWGGLTFELVNELARRLNFSYEVYAAEVFGAEDQGTFSGLLGMLQNQSVEFVAASLTVTDSRDKVADFTFPYYVDYRTIIMHKEDQTLALIFICFSPFHVYVWISLGVSIVVVSTTMWILINVDPTKTYHTRNQEPLRSLRLNVWQIFGSFFQQGLFLEPKSCSVRFVLAFWWIFVIIIVGTYNGNLIAYLTAANVKPHINNLEELLKSDLDFGFLEQTSLHQRFYSAPSNSLDGKLWDRIKDKQHKLLPQSDREGVQRAISSHTYVYIADLSVYESRFSLDIRGLDKCEYQRSEEVFYDQMYALAFVQGSPHTDRFTKVIHQILQSGLVHRWKTKWFSHIDPCIDTVTQLTDQNDITVVEAQGPMYLLLCGAVTAGLIFLTERTLSSLRGKNNVLTGDRNVERRKHLADYGELRLLAFRCLSSLRK